MRGTCNLIHDTRTIRIALILEDKPFNNAVIKIIDSQTVYINNLYIRSKYVRCSLEIKMLDTDFSRANDCKKIN